MAATNQYIAIMNRLEVKEIVSQGESTTVEFKKTTGQLERGMETLCAFLVSTVFRIPQSVDIKDGITENQGKNQGKNQNGKRTPSKSEELNERIIAVMMETPNISYSMLAKMCDRNKDTIWRHVRALQEKGRVRHVGPKKGGSWEVVEQEEQE